MVSRNAEVSVASNNPVLEGDSWTELSWNWNEFFEELSASATCVTPRIRPYDCHHLTNHWVESSGSKKVKQGLQGY